MENSVLYTMPVTYVILFAIVLFHIGAAILPTLTGDKRMWRIALYAIAAINLLLHVGLFAFAIAKQAPASEILLALMISAAVGSISIGFKKKS